VERFFSSLKREWGRRLYATCEQAMTDIREYVAMYYNSARLHSTLGYKTPLIFESVVIEMPVCFGPVPTQSPIRGFRRNLMGFSCTGQQKVVRCRNRQRPQYRDWRRDCERAKFALHEDAHATDR
jgi:hypothetical protein